MIFEIGRSAVVGRRAAYWRNIASVVVILGVMIGVVSSFIATRLTTP
jgi:hypothetical protein